MDIKPKIMSQATNTLSKFRTDHYFKYYGEIESIDDYRAFAEWAGKNKKKIFILGNGSNTLFSRKKVKSLVLKNCLPPEIKCISKDEYLYEVSSTVKTIDILNYCYKKSLDSFYYLASVPATIGGALAMNAGEGKSINKSIYDYVESVTYISKDNSINVIRRDEMNIGYRETMFTGCKDNFIIKATFRFPNRTFGDISPIKERLIWSKQNQDNVAPNCGTVFSYTYKPIMRLLKGFKIANAEFSPKAHSWINNNSKSHIPIVLLVLLAKILHIFLLKKCKLELIKVK